jgi:hypothetical protein
MCIHVPSGAALQEPAGGGPRTIIAIIAISPIIAIKKLTA